MSVFLFLASRRKSNCGPANSHRFGTPFEQYGYRQVIQCLIEVATGGGRSYLAANAGVLRLWFNGHHFTAYGEIGL